MTDLKDPLPDVSEPAVDYTIDQGWENYTAEDNAVWKTLFERQEKLLPGRVNPAFLEGLEALSFGAEGIPDFRRMSEVLMRETGWQVVAVPGLVPDDVFFTHLANRRFPATNWIRKREQLDYLQEPDNFHDVFGHVPLLINPVFADYMQAYGVGGLKALERGVLHRLARLYWYTVEFGLMKSVSGGFEIYGAGIVSSKTESIFCLDDPSPNRVAFDLKRILRSDYRIDDFQETYFVIEGFEQLLALAELPFDAIYDELEGQEDLAPGVLLDSDHVLTRGTGSYHAAKRAAAE